MCSTGSVMECKHIENWQGKAEMRCAPQKAILWKNIDPRARLGCWQSRRIRCTCTRSSLQRVSSNWRFGEFGEMILQKRRNQVHCFPNNVRLVRSLCRQMQDKFEDLQSQVVDDKTIQSQTWKSTKSVKKKLTISYDVDESVRKRESQPSEIPSKAIFLDKFNNKGIRIISFW